MISVVIPFYNEEQRLDSGVKLIEGIKSILSFFETELSAYPKDYLEFVLVDDGSLDNTATILNRVKESLSNTSIKVLSYLPNRGKGYALRQGMKAAHGDYCLIMDADMSTPLNTFCDFEKSPPHDLVLSVSLTGLYLWPGAERLCRFAAYNPHLFAQKRVIELGAGAGLGSAVHSTPSS